MESSSDDSFSWTDTSSDTVDSHPMAPKNHQFDKHGKKYETHNIDDVQYDNNFKIKQESLSDSISPLKKLIKVISESDSDTYNRKKKIKKAKIFKTDAHQKTDDDSCYDESYLNLKVKQEDINAVKKKNKIEEHVTTQEPRYDDVSVGRSSYVENNTEPQPKKKKKKSKRKNENKIQELLEIDEVSLNCRHDKNDSDLTEFNAKSTDMSLTNNPFDNETCNEISAIQCEDYNTHTLSFNCDRTVQKDTKKVSNDLYKSALMNKMDTNVGGEIKQLRLSDRLRFEDDSDNELGSLCQKEQDKTSSKLQKFIQSCNNVQLISQDLLHGTTLSDDDIWIVQCPRQIDVEAFSGMELNMHEKSKIKVGRQVFEGSVEDEPCGTAAIMTSDYGKYRINNVPLSGIIKFRKRIPKAHFRDDNVMVNNQTNFIPLPETKCRHPLFGSKYKKAIKIASAVSLRLNPHIGEESREVNIDKRKKKKHKKYTSSLENESTLEVKSEVRHTSKPDLTQNDPEKKKKKRKRLEDEGPSAKRIKKIKHNPESEEAWASEKAIEQNLFDF